MKERGNVVSDCVQQGMESYRKKKMVVGRKNRIVNSCTTFCKLRHVSIALINNELVSNAE
jgi:hypothetical protein